MFCYKLYVSLFSADIKKYIRNFRSANLKDVCRCYMLLVLSFMKYSRLICSSALDLPLEFRCRDLGLIYFCSVIMAVHRLERDLRLTIQKAFLFGVQDAFLEANLILVYLLLCFAGH